jgi:hypothetical protein
MTLDPRPSDAELLARANAKQGAKFPDRQSAQNTFEQNRDIAQRAAIAPGPNAIHSAIKGKRTRKPTNDEPEHLEQVELFRRLDAEGYDMPELRQAYAVPNGGKRGRLTAKKMKAEGVRAGELDINLDLARGGYHGLRLEMKAPGRSMSVLQSARAAEHQANGYAVDTAYSADDAERILRYYMKLPKTLVERPKGLTR